MTFHIVSSPCGARAFGEFVQRRETPRNGSATALTAVVAFTWLIAGAPVWGNRTSRKLSQAIRGKSKRFADRCGARHAAGDRSEQFLRRDGRAPGNLRIPAWRGVLTDKEIWEAVAYVLVLSHSSR
jgi:hypothetical protein